MNTIFVCRVKTRGLTSSSSAEKSKIGSLDKILKDLAGPKVISTVTKSNYDWENFKETENLVDDLAKATKSGDGFLSRQDFLDRVDVRSFEKERDERLRNAILREGTGGGGL